MKAHIMHYRLVTAALLTAQFLFGFAIIAALPPFEGMDETAHFARVQAQAFRPVVTEEKEAGPPHISLDVYNYYRRGPMPYHWVTLGSLHEDDPVQGGYITYHAFFQQQAKALREYTEIYQHSQLPAGYKAGPERNWQYQHPFLYYAMASAVLKFVAGHASLLETLFTLRFFSFLLAFAGFTVGLLGTYKYLKESNIDDAGAITALGAFYPFLMPEYFWEFTRVGNDSLCLFLFGITWALLLKHLRNPRGDVWLYMSILMGLGWLAKAILIPVSLAIIVFLVFYHLLVVRSRSEHVRDWWWAPLKVLAVTLVVGVPFYAVGFVHAHYLGGAHFTAVLNKPDAWLLLKQNFSWSIFFDQMGITLRTAIWEYGSWSRAVIDLPTYKFLYLFTGAIFLFYLRAPRKRLGALYWLPLILPLAMLLGLIAHVLTVFILQNNDRSPGYYLHTLAPCFALIYGVGLQSISKGRILAKIIAPLSALVIAFNFFILWSYMTMFSGCAVPPEMQASFRLLPADILHCTTQFHVLFTNLAIVAWPGVALASMSLCFILLIAAAFTMGRISWRPRRASYD